MKRLNKCNFKYEQSENGEEPNKDLFTRIINSLEIECYNLNSKKDITFKVKLSAEGILEIFPEKEVKYNLKKPEYIQMNKGILVSINFHGYYGEETLNYKNPKFEIYEDINHVIIYHAPEELKKETKQHINQP